MIKIERFSIEYSQKEIITDNEKPVFSFSLFSDKNNVKIKKCIFNLNNWNFEFVNERIIKYNGEKLKPLTDYEASLIVECEDGDIDSKKVKFSTGLLDTRWKGEWISDGSYNFIEKKVSPKPLVFRKRINLKNKPIKSISLYSTSIGIYEVYVNDSRVSNTYFKPGFTSYKHNLEYQKFDLTNRLVNNDYLYFVVAGGWAVGSFVMNRVNRYIHNRQCLLAEIHITYSDGDSEIIASDNSWEVTRVSQFVSADLYDGEVYDANLQFTKSTYIKATIERLNFNPKLVANYGVDVIKHEKMTPKFLHKANGKLIFDFEQYFAGIVHFDVKNAQKGNKIVVKHAELLDDNGDLNTKLLRSAKAEIVYICSDEKEQSYEPTFTYMGFRYISVEGTKLEDIEVYAYALYSDLDIIGDFKCSNQLINRLQDNIIWSSKSNFIDIPTDCPQRDERMGWTGDINVFTPTAYFNFDMTRFLKKWLLDVKSEQGKGGGIPNTIPSNGYGFPLTMPLMAIDFWGDAIVTIPYYIYEMTGDKEILSDYFISMKKYVDAENFWANLFSFGKNRYIFKTINMLHFGDWIAPDCNKMSQWQARHKWTATISLKLCSDILSKTAGLIGDKNSEKKYKDLSQKVKDAFKSKFLNDEMKLHEEFQTGYVLPIYFDVFDDNEKNKAASNLATLVKKNNYCIGTGFPGTPYVLFSLFDNKQKDCAEKMLLNTNCPSWLYEVKVGGTTIWERWDGLNEDGKINLAEDGTGGMISFNHYASGAVGDFLYRRIAGIQLIEPGYRKFEIKPNIMKTIDWVNASTYSLFGKISSCWKVKDGMFSIDVEIPIGSECKLIMPSGKIFNLENGKYHFEEKE